MKVCSKCKETKLWKEFGYGDLRSPYPSQWFVSQCKSCKSKAAVERYKTNQGAVWRRRRDRTRARYWQYLLEHPCVDCGETDIVVLEPDHRDPTTKNHNISTLIARTTVWEKILAELALCDIRCANCHHRRTAQQAAWPKANPTLVTTEIAQLSVLDLEADKDFVRPAPVPARLENRKKSEYVRAS